MVETFNPPRHPSPESTKAPTPRVMQADFGDGYEQRAEDGINPLRDSWNVVFNGLTKEETGAIEDFFRQHKGVKSFWWTAPWETIPKRWICQKWPASYPEPPFATITAEFKQVFDL